jgi:hypothetical protein
MSGYWPNKTTSVTIPGRDATGLSAVFFNPGRMTSIQMPATWTAAQLTFQGSPDGITYTNIYDSNGNEVIVQAAASELVTIDREESQTYMKIRSGTSGAPVTQGGDRILKVMRVAQVLPGRL